MILESLFVKNALRKSINFVGTYYDDASFSLLSGTTTFPYMFTEKNNMMNMGKDLPNPYMVAKLSPEFIRYLSLSYGATINAFTL